jgi:hypothetical protein
MSTMYGSSTANHVLRERLTNLTVTMPLAFRIVFSMPLYIGIAAAIFTTFWIKLVMNLFYHRYKKDSDKPLRYVTFR